MTKTDIERLVKRYKYIKILIKKKLSKYSFYIGNRKHTVEWSEELEKLYQTVEDVYAHIREDWIKKLIGELLKGCSDVALLQRYPCGRNYYYGLKREFIEAIYRGCISKQMITYEELLEIGISR